MNDMGFIEMAKMFAQFSTDAPLNYSEITAIQMLGHALGRDVVHKIQPDAEYHNSYVGLIGDSTWTRKSTVQRLSKKVYPKDRCTTNQLGSPEGFTIELSNMPKNEGFKWLGELSKVLKGINKNDYTSGFAELWNELFDCQKWDKPLVPKKDDKEKG